MVQISVKFDEKSYSELMRYKPRWQKKSEYVRNLAMRQLEEETLKKQGGNAVSNPPLTITAVPSPWQEFLGGAANQIV